MDLQTIIDRFALTTQSLPDAALENAWQWGDYDEGVRLAFFRTYEDLRNLAANLEAQRILDGQPITPAQRRLAYYHAAYHDLRGLTLGISDEQAMQTPAPDQWSLRRILVHIIGAERSFYTVSHYALQRARLLASMGQELPLAISDQDEQAMWADDDYAALEDGMSFSALWRYYAGLHQRVLTDFAATRAGELDAASMFWETTPFPLSYRLHRFDSHLRQHTVQVEKALLDLFGPPNEARRLLRLIYAALAEVQSVTVTAGAGFGAQACQMLAGELSSRSDEIATAVAS